jgi:hypothetical protein
VATKANGLLVPLVVLPWALVYRRRAFLPLLLSLAVLGPLVMIATWPWLWHDTLPGLLRYVAFFGKHYPVAVTYFGRVYNVAPWHFPLVMTLITTPPLTLLLALVGLGRVRCPTASGSVTPSTRRHWPAGWSAHQAAIVVLIAWAVVVNLAPMCLPGTPKYNGVRLFMPVFPPLALLAGVGFGVVGRRLAKGVARVLPDERLALGLCLTLALLPSLMATAYTHPYGMSYYNVLTGGLRGAVARGMEATYWGETYFAAVPWLNHEPAPGSRVWINVPGFVTSMAMYQAFGLLRPDLKLTGGTEALKQADLCVVINKPTEWGPEARGLVARAQVAAGRALFTEKLQGVPLVWVLAGPKMGGEGGARP